MKNYALFANVDWDVSRQVTVTGGFD